LVRSANIARLQSSPLTAAVLYHQPDKMLKAANDLAERQENLEKLKKQHGID
jgi:hypothetical protein